MKKRVFCVLASLVVLTWGCTNELEQVVEQEPSAVEVVEEPTVTLEFTAGFEGTKTALDDTHVLWEAGDQIVLFPMKYTDSSFADDDTWLGWTNDTGKIAARATIATGNIVGILSDALTVGGSNATFTFTVSEGDAEKVASADYYVAFVYVPGSSLSSYSFAEDRKYNGASSIIASFFATFYYPFEYSQSAAFHHLAYAKNNGGTSLSFKNLHPVLKFTTNNPNVVKAILRDGDDEDTVIARTAASCRRSGSAYPALNPTASGASSSEVSYIQKVVVPGEPTYMTLHSYYSFPNGFTIKLLNSSDEVIATFVYGSAFTPTVGHITTITNFDDRLN